MRVKKSYQVLNKSDAAVLVVDASLGLCEEDFAFIEHIQNCQLDSVLNIFAVRHGTNNDVQTFAGNKLSGILLALFLCQMRQQVGYLKNRVAPE